VCLVWKLRSALRSAADSANTGAYSADRGCRRGLRNGSGRMDGRGEASYLGEAKRPAKVSSAHSARNSDVVPVVEGCTRTTTLVET
jgi:hypothetical protein